MENMGRREFLKRCISTAIGATGVTVLKVAPIYTYMDFSKFKTKPIIFECVCGTPITPPVNCRCFINDELMGIVENWKLNYGKTKGI